MPIKASASITGFGPYQIYIRIEGDLPKATNALLGAHWRKKHANAVLWKKIVYNAAYAFRPQQILETATIKIQRSSHRMLDFDGLVASCKPVVDGLKGLILRDDSWARTGPWNVTQEFRAKANGPLLEIWITQK